MATQMRTHTPYDFPHLEELQRVSAKSFAKKTTLPLRVFLFLLGGFDLISGIFFAIQGSIGLSVFLCLMGAVILAWAILFYAVRAWLVGKTLGDPNFHNDFVFGDEHLVVYVGDETAEVPYAACVSLLEAEHSFYMMMPNKQGLIMDKDNLTGGTTDDLRAFLEEKCRMPVKWLGKNKAN